VSHMPGGISMSRDELPPCNSPSPTGCTASRHGTVTAYQVDRCRCPDAKAAQARYRKQLMWRRYRGDEATVDATGTRRRIHALMAIGWSRSEILTRLGYRDTRNRWLTRVERVNRRTASRVTALYDELSNSSGPSGQTAAWARNHGYLPPLWWDDDLIDDPTYNPLFIENPPNPPKMEIEPTCGSRRSSSTPSTRSTTPSSPDIDHIVIERLIAGEPPLHVTRAERAEAVRLLDHRGHTRSEIAVQLRMSGARVAQILDATVREAPHTPDTTNDRQEASA
jgi:hypothetical protein